MRRVPLTHVVLAVALLAFFALLLVWPVVQVVIAGFRDADGNWTGRYVALVFQDPQLVRGLVNATLIALCATAATLVLALPLAVLSVRFDFPFRSWLTPLLLVPLILPPFVGAIGMRLIFGREGALTSALRAVGFDLPPEGLDWLASNRFLGIVVVEALHLYPILLVNLQAALANVDPALQQAASNLGAGRWTTFRRVTLPLIRPGLFAGGTIVLIWSFTELGTPLMFDYTDVTPVQVFARLAEASSSPLPFALVAVMLAASTLLYVVGKLLLGRGFDAATTKASTASAPRRLKGVTGWLATMFFVAVIGLAVIPHVSVALTSVSEVGAWYESVVPRAFTAAHFRGALTDELALPSVGNSVVYAGCATLLALVVGLGVAVLVVRSDLPGRNFLDALAMLPLAVPGLVLAFGYLSISVLFVRAFPAATATGGSTSVGTLLAGIVTPGDAVGPLAFLNVQGFPVVLLVLAYAARRLPYVVRAAVAGLQQTPRDLELAALNVGATRATTLRRITVPLIAANLLAGGLLAFAFAVLEVSDSLILAQQRDFYPLTKAIYELNNRLGDGLYIASALGVWAMALLTLTILTANAILSKRMGAIFRV